jgi:hypothetical protein
MAIRKFIFFNGTEGYNQEQASNDELSLGKVTLSGVSGVALDVGGADIANLGAPTGANSAARKAYVDSGITAEATARQTAVNTLTSALQSEAQARIAADSALQSEIDTEEAARILGDSTLTSALQSEAQARISADSALQNEIDAEEAARANAISGVQSALSLEATARANADTTLNAAILNEATLREQADQTLTDNLSSEAQARISADNAITTAYGAADTALSGSLTSAFQAADAQVVTQLQAYADSLKAGFTVKAPVKVIATANVTLSGTQTVDGVALTAGDRVLVAGQTAGQDNGVYVVSSGSWTRATDADSSTEVKDGLSVFVEQGTEFHDSTWVLVTNNDITLGTTALEFVRFSGLGQVTAGDGLGKSGNELFVKVGAGMQLANDEVALKADTSRGLSVDGSAGVRVDLAAGKGLEFSGGDIAVKLESDAGMMFDATNGGLELKLVSPNRLVKSDSGLDVVGLPSLFRINGTQVHENFTAQATNFLAGGPYTDSTNLHNHARVAGNWNAAEELATHKAVYLSGSNTVAVASCSSASTARVVGINRMNYNSSLSPNIVTHGKCDGFSGLTPASTYFLGANGSPVEYSALVAGDRVVRLGYAVTASEMFVAIQDLGQKA